MRPPTITITPSRNATNVGPAVSRVALVRAGPGRDHQGRAAQDEDRDRNGQHVRQHELHLGGADLLAQELWGPADHQPGDEDGEQCEHQDRIKPAAVPARTDLAEEDGDERCRSACMETAVWPTKMMAMTAMMAYACRGLPMSLPNMKMMANGSTITKSRSNMFVKPVGFSNG
jgi:hypothetical protein